LPTPTEILTELHEAQADLAKRVRLIAIVGGSALGILALLVFASGGAQATTVSPELQVALTLQKQTQDRAQSRIQALEASLVALQQSFQGLSQRQASAAPALTTEAAWNNPSGSSPARRPSGTGLGQAPLVQAPPPPEVSNQFRGVKATVVSATRRGNKVDVVMTLIATNQDVRLHLRSPADCVDNLGNIYTSLGTTIANDAITLKPRRTLVSGVPTRTTVSFEGISQDASSLALLTLWMEYSHGLKLRNIPITQG